MFKNISGGVAFWMAGILTVLSALSTCAGTNSLIISNYGAVGDGATVNTAAIQSAIDQCAALGGGTIVVPAGVFVTGSITLDPGVSLQIQAGGILKGSTNQSDYPIINGRIAGAFQPNPMALINATNNNNLSITGPGILDGSGLVQHSLGFTNLYAEYPYPQLGAFQDCSNLTVSGITFSNTSFWNCHLYRCNNSTIQNVRFVVTATVPSSDGTDIDSSSNVVVNGCYYHVYDDCIALKGTRGSNALADASSPPTGHILITNCLFAAGQGGVTCGSEATLVHDVDVENCTNDGAMPMIRYKMRVDTPGQDYEDLRYNNLTLAENFGTIISVELNHGNAASPEPPESVIRNVNVSNVNGFYEIMGTVANTGYTFAYVSNFTLVDFNVRLTNVVLTTSGAANVTFNDVFVNATPWTGVSSTAWGATGNWNTNLTRGVPSTNYSAMFNSSFGNQPTLSASSTAQALCLVDGVGQDVTINASAPQILSLTGNAIENNVGGTGILMTDTNNHNLTLGANVAVVLTNATSIFNQEISGTLTITGSLTNNGSTLTISGAGVVVISGPISGGGALTKNGAGTVTLSGANTYSGQTTVNAGKLVLTTAQTGTGAITVADGATLDVTTTGSGQLSPASMTLGKSAGATLEYNNLTNTASPPLHFGSLTRNGTVTVNIDSGALTAGITYPLMPGTATNGFILGLLPPGIQAHLTAASGTINLTVDTITTSAPATPTGLSATAGNGQVSLSWTASSGASSYILGRAAVNNGPFTSIFTNATTSYVDTGLINGTTYYYVIAAANTIGQSTNSVPVGATPLLSAPPAPAGLSATAGNGQVSLSWAASAGATNYVVKRSTTNGSGYMNVATNATTIYTDNDLLNGTTYFYVVSALGAGGESVNSSGAAATPVAGIVVMDSPGAIVSGSGTNFTTPVTVTTGANALVVLIGNMKESSTTAIPAVTWNGQTLTNAVLLSSGSTGAKSGIFYIYNPATDGAAHNLSCTFTTGSTGWLFQYYTLSGVNTAVAPLTGSVTGGTATISCTVNNCPAYGLAMLDAFYSNNASPVSLPAYGSGVLNALYVSASNPTCAMGYASGIAAGTDTFSASTTTASSKFALTIAVFTPAAAPGNTPPVLSPLVNQTINVGANLSITNTATDSDVPAQTLTFTLSTEPTNASIGSASGILAWRPLVSQANTTNLFSVVVTDNGTPPMSATQSFNVTVNPLTMPSVSVVQAGGGQVGISISGQTGPDYEVQSSTDLMSWNTSFITNPATMPFSWTTNIGSLPAQYYRIKVGPPLP